MSANHKRNKPALRATVYWIETLYQAREIPCADSRNPALFSVLTAVETRVSDKAFLFKPTGDTNLRLVVAVPEQDTPVIDDRCVMNGELGIGSIWRRATAGRFHQSLTCQNKMSLIVDSPTEKTKMCPLIRS